ncbi:MAG: DUF362 domain-containing protein [Lachnospiraceae bacterium]|nr:DUF362 domain-containing protein [Lachnospiraceae bacterium]
MEKAKVYFTDFRTQLDVSILEKLKKLCRKAGIDSIDMKGKFVAIKMNFGERGNMAFLRPSYARAIAELVQENGGIPFLTDCNTLYAGYRRHALEHMDTANLNGFNTVTTGCQIVIADGLRGTDDVIVPVPNGEYCEEAYVGRALMDADIIISLNHFKGHELTGFGGAIKNIGMGGGSRAGKMHQHSACKPSVDQSKCRACRRCVGECGSDAISLKSGRAFIDPDICKGCGRCIGACAFDAITVPFNQVNGILNCKMAEYTAAIVNNRPQFHVSLAMDISPCCDCHCENDAPILPNIGMFASMDPVAIDQCAYDMCQKATPVDNSQLGDNLKKIDWKKNNDHFKDTNPTVDTESALAHGEKIGLGTRDYEMIVMK